MQIIAMAMWTVLTILLCLSCVFLHDLETTYLAAAVEMKPYAEKCGWGTEEQPK